MDPPQPNKQAPEAKFQPCAATQTPPPSYTPHCPITLPLTITPQATDALYKSQAMHQPFQFEVYAPISCAHVGIGCYNHSTKHLESYEFRTTTQRTVSVNVNTDIVCLVNGNKPQNKDKKKTDGGEGWGIGLRVKDKGNLAVLNPYVVGANPLSLYTLAPVKGELERPIQQHFTNRSLDLSNIKTLKVGKRTIYLKHNLICYNQTFDLPLQRTSIITLVDPNRPGFHWTSSLDVIKAQLNDSIGFWLRELELTVSAFRNKEEAEKPKHNLDEIYASLDSLLRIDEQLRCRLLHSRAEALYKEFYPNGMRLYTAIQRLASFVGYGNTKYRIEKLAEIGFYNKTDTLQNLAHYESPHSDISNIEEGPTIPEEELVKTQLPFIRSQQGLPFPNVPLEVSLSSHPAQHCGSEQPVISVNTAAGRYLGTVTKDKKFSLFSTQQQLLNLITFDCTKIKPTQPQIKKQQSVEPLQSQPSNKPTPTNPTAPGTTAQPPKPPNKVVQPNTEMLQILVGMGFPSALCLKALVMTENESVQAVIDMIETIKTQQQQQNKKTKQEKKLKIKAEWQCKFCTLKNVAPNEACEICANPAPEDAFFNEEELREKEMQRERDEEQARLKEKAELEMKAQMELKAQQEEEDRKKREIEELKQQEIRKLQQQISQSTLTTFKILYNPLTPLTPFTILFLFTINSKSRLRAFRIGLSQSYISKFYRVENPNLIVSNHDQTIHQNNSKGIAQIISQAREVVEWGRKLFEPVGGDWVVTGASDLAMEEEFEGLEVSGRTVRVLGKEGRSVWVEVEVNEDPMVGLVSLKRLEDPPEGFKAEGEQQKAAPEQQPAPISTISARPTSPHNEALLPAGTCFIQVQLIQHLAANSYQLIPQQVPLNTDKSYSQQSQKSLMSNYIPLLLQKWQGSCCNQKHIPSALFQPGPIFVSNYGSTSFTFKALQGLPMIVETVTVLSELKTINGGNPVASGLIFTSNEVSWFNVAKSRFGSMRKQEYDRWLERRRGAEELAFWEPVGAFELKESEKSIEFQLDFKRPTKYVYLLPTSVKKCTKKLEEAEINLDFFGVKGRLIEDNGQQIQLVRSTASQIESQGSHCAPLQILSVDSQGKQLQFPPDQILISQKSQINGIDFLNTPTPSSLQNLPLSISTYLLIRLKNPVNRILLRTPIPHTLNLITHQTLNPLTQSQSSILSLSTSKDSTLVARLLHQFYINPFMAESVAEKLDVGRFLLLHVLAERERLYEAENLIKILENQKGFKERLLREVLGILKRINEKEVEVSAEGLKSLFGILQRNYLVGKQKTVKAVIKIWDITSDFVKQIRNPSYRIVRNKYGIQQLILQRRLFSEYYHHLIESKPSSLSQPSNPSARTSWVPVPPKPVTTTTTTTSPAPAPATVSSGTQTTTTTTSIPQPPTTTTVQKVSIPDTPPHLTMNTVIFNGSTVNYVRLAAVTSVRSLDLYFDKSMSPLGRFKMRLRVYEAREVNGELWKRLLFHQCFNEETSVQLTNYAYTPQSSIYKAQSNVLSLAGLNVTTQHLIIKVDYSLLPMRFVKKAKDALQQVLILPIAIESSTTFLPTPTTCPSFSNTALPFSSCYMPQPKLPQTADQSEHMPIRRTVTLSETNTFHCVYCPLPKPSTIIDNINEHVSELASNIMNEEFVRAKTAGLNFKSGTGEKGLDFSYTFLMQLNKFVRQGLLLEEGLQANAELGETLLKLYETFVVYEIGPIEENILSLVVDLLKKLPQLEAHRIVVRVVERYLSDSEKLKKLTITEEYQIKHVLATLKKVQQLPFAQLLQMLGPDSSKLMLTNILLLLKDCLKKPTLQRHVYNLSSNQLLEVMSYNKMLQRLFDTSLLILKGLDQQPSSFQSTLLGISLDTVLEFFEHIITQQPTLVKPLIDGFLNRYAGEDLWRLIFIAIKLKEEGLEAKINLLVKHLISNVNEAFSKSINRMIGEIINKKEKSLYMQINKQVSDQIWMRHLQTVLEFLIKSQKEQASKVFLDLETSECLLQLPLTPALWSLTLSILPRDERILEPLIKHLTPELSSVLSYDIMAFCEPLANIKLPKSQQLNWLEIVRKLKLEGKTLFELFVEELKRSSFGGRQALTMAKQNAVLQLQTTDDLLELVLQQKKPFFKMPQPSTVRDMIQWYVLNRSTQTGLSPATQLLKSVSDNMLKLFVRFHEDEGLVKVALAELLAIKKETEIIETLCKEKLLNSYTSVSLNQRICECFEQLVGTWMTTDNLAHYFAFNIGGFEYIFSLIGVDQPNSTEKQQSKPQLRSLPQDSYLQSLDLISSQRPTPTPTATSSTAPSKKPQTKSQSTSNTATTTTASPPTGISDLKQQQLANKVKMHKLPNQTVTVSNEDWSTHKKGTKNKLFYVHMVPPFYSEYPLVVELDKVAEIRSIRLGFTSDPSPPEKLSITPSSVVVDGGLDVEHLEPLGELTLLNDQGYCNSAAKVFVKNFQMIKPGPSTIEQCIKSLANSKIKVLKFTIRRPVVTFIQGTSMLNGKNYKSLGFNVLFLSVMGYDVAKMPAGLQKRCHEISKRTALVVLSKLFNESFISTIYKLANEPSFVSKKIKQNFREISNLMDQYGDLVSSINYILGANNEELGDWMIEYFLKNGNKESHARLISQILLSNASKIYPRLQTIQTSILSKLGQISAFGGKAQGIVKLNELFPYLENFCTSLDASLNTVGSSNVDLVLQCTKDDIINILNVYDTSYSATTLIKLLVTLIYIRKPYRLSQDLLDYTLDRIWSLCSEQKLHFYDLLSAMVVNRRSVPWLQQHHNSKVTQLIQSTYKSITQLKLKLVRAQIGLITQISQHLHSHLLSLQCHIQLYHKLKSITFTNSDILNCLVKIIKNVVLNNPGSEASIAEMLMKDLDLLARKKDALLQTFYVDVLGIEREVNVAMKGLSTLPKQDFTIPSVLLSKGNQVSLMKKISVKAKFSLLLTVGQQAVPKAKVIKIIHNPPYLLVMKFTLADDPTKSVICGVYCSTQPHFQQQGEVTIPQGPNNFLFYFSDQKTIFLESKPGSSQRFGFYPTQDDFFLVYSHGGAQTIKLCFDGNSCDSQANFSEDSNLVFHSCEFWQLKQLNSSTLALSLGTQAVAPISYYRPEPVYIVPYHISAEKLLRVLGVSTKLMVMGREVEKDQVIGEFEPQTEDFIVDMEVNLANCTTVTPEKGYIPRMLIYKEFEKQQGVDKLIEIGVQSVKTWKKLQAKKKWQQFLQQLKLFVHIPNFFGLFIKNLQCFALLFQVVAGLPDQSTSKNWQQQQLKATRFIYQILADIFRLDKSPQLRSLELNEGFIEVVLDKLAFISKETVRRYEPKTEAVEGTVEKEEEKKEVVEQQKEGPATPAPKETEKGKKKKGTGYGVDSNPTSKWSPAEYIQHRKQMSEEILRIITILVNFLDSPEPTRDGRLSRILQQSCLLPLIQSNLRSGSILDISKEPVLFKNYLQLIRTLAKNANTLDCLLKISSDFKPQQTESIVSLLEKLNKTADIFLSCMQTNKEDVSTQTAEDIGHDIKFTYVEVTNAIERHNRAPAEAEMREIMKLPLAEAYRKMLGPLRFDYVSMKQGTAYKHHWSNLITEAIPPASKVLRLSQQLADLSSSLPCEHTNSIFIRCDKQRVDIIRIIIMGSKDTPYSNGAFTFDIFCEDVYPNSPPKMAITTTGNGKIRFNPNLYSCGKVCLSLLGTWRGSANENWDPKLSTLLQLFISTQGITMSEDIYFNEPGFQGEQGTEEGEKKNQAYANIVRLGNVRYAMIQQIKNPPKGFQTVIHRHFYLKRHQILEQCQKWIKLAQTRQASYVSLVSDHNNSWCSQLKQSKTKYKQLLVAAVNELEQVLNKLEQPKLVEHKQVKIKKPTKPTAQTSIGHTEQIDMKYDEAGQGKELDYEDEKVRDRWSRYIGAMGVEAVKKQAESQVLLVGLGALGLEIAKNLVLSGLKRLTIVDNEKIRSHWEHFYMSDMPGELRSKCLFKLKQLNHYVKVDHSPQLPSDLSPYNLIIDTRSSQLPSSITLSQTCNKLNIKFILAESRGVYGRLFNDFGTNFSVNDSNGQQPVEVILKNITNEENALVTLIEGARHPYEDGECVVIDMVEGMEVEKEEKDQEEVTNEQKFYNQLVGAGNKEKSEKSVNGRVFKVKVVNSNSFRINGDTRGLGKYVRNGIAKNIKMPKKVTFKPLTECLKNLKDLPFDSNLQVYDFEKMSTNTIVSICFDTLGDYMTKHNKQPLNWSHEDATAFSQLAKQKIKQVAANQEEQDQLVKFAYEFALTADSELPVLSAYLGGIVAQEVIKAITNKFQPVKQLFAFHFKELLPEIPAQEEFPKMHVKDSEEFYNLKVNLSRAVATQLEKSKVFVIGAGAIGCELLKNFAMMNLCSNGQLTITDPDHIQTSNLNRQFLFREKHLRKPKSATAAAAIYQMNPLLKGHITSKLDKVCDTTENIYNDKFFQELSVVANALDNVQARLYVDKRCVLNKKPLLESGTLGPKGHVQVIIPFVTESYGSQNDPVEENQIPHCTLKLFPEDTLHCIEWSRDIFGKVFTLRPKGLKKLIEDVKQSGKITNVDASVIQALKVAKKAPTNFDDCISYAVKKFFKYYRNDILQLLHTYPLDAKTKDGQPFWKLPKRPPKPLSSLDPTDELQSTFISSYAVLRAKTFGLPYPKNFRTEEGKKEIMEKAVKVKVKDFVVSEEKSKKISKLQEEKVQEQEEEQKQALMVEEVKEEKEEHKELELPKEVAGLEVSAQEFEKDEDSNGHIDLIWSMSNLRSKNYSLSPYTWIQTKLKAGRIMPALATTTTVISAYQTLQLIQVIRKSKLVRNAFINLAVPIVQISEPGPVAFTAVGNTKISVWDTWELKATTLKEVFEQIKQKYEVEPVNALVGGEPVFISAYYKGKEQESKKIMERKLRELLEMDKDDEFVDFNISLNDLKTGEAIEKVPAVRVIVPKQ